MTHPGDDEKDAFTEAFLQLHRLAGAPRAHEILERATALRATDEKVRKYGKPPTDSTIDGWLKSGRVPRSENQLLLVVRILTRMAHQRDKPRPVPAHLKEPDAWRRRMRASGPPPLFSQGRVPPDHPCTGGPGEE
jgi:hypothetical protein